MERSEFREGAAADDPHRVGIARFFGDGRTRFGIVLFDVHDERVVVGVIIPLDADAGDARQPQQATADLALQRFNFFFRRHL